MLYRHMGFEKVRQQNFFKTPYGANIEIEMRIMKHLLSLLILVAASLPDFAQQWSVSSPDKNLKLTLQNQNGVLTYTITSGATELVKPSALGIETNSGSFSNGLSFVNTMSRKIDETYTMISGKRLQNHAVGNETSVLLRGATGLLRIDLRAYNDGVAFRYAFPEKGKTITVTHENTAFGIATSGKFWAQPYDLPSQYTPAYESTYE